jgi:hypothetical protein
METRGRHWGRSIAAVLGVLGTLVLVAGQANALAIHESKRTETMSTAFDSVTSTCPKGEGAVGGGYTVPPFNGGSAFFVPAGSFLGDGRGWQASAQAFGEGADLDGQTITSFAYCSKLGKKVVVRGDSTDVSDGTFSDVTASCKRGESLLSGGWAISSPPGTAPLVQKSIKQGKRSWRAFGGMTTGSGTLIALADCVPAKKAPKLVARKGSSDVSGEAAEVDASCRQNEKVLSAGYTSDGAYFPFDFHRDTKQTWLSTGTVFSGPGTTAKVIAYCVRSRRER